MLKISFSIIAAVVIIASSLISFHAGVFDKINFLEENRGPYTLVYKEYRGSYSTIGYRINDVLKLIKSDKNIKVNGGFALFYDNPHQSPADSLRSICGIFTDSLVSVKTPLKIAEYKETYCIVGKFPLRSFFSYITGLYKFYPALEKYCKVKGIHLNSPVMELIDTKNKTILYVISTSNIASFPEFGK